MEDKIVEGDFTAKAEGEILKPDVDSLDLTEQEVFKRSQEKLIEMSNSLSKDLADFLNNKIAEYKEPFPIAVVLNACMYIYTSTVISSLPLDKRVEVIEDHFRKVLDDLEKNGKI
jgi:hypothetical protein